MINVKPAQLSEEWLERVSGIALGSPVPELLSHIAWQQEQIEKFLHKGEK